MHILVINSGSSSLKFSIFEADPTLSAAPQSRVEGELSGVGSAHASLKLHRAGEAAATRAEPKIDGSAAAAELIFDLMAQPGMPQIDAIGYRVVHPGPHVTGHQRITPELLTELDHAITFAPLHDPAVLTVIRAAMQRFPTLGHYACFDTEFHRTMPAEATTYAIPKSFRDQGVRRYGFHGLSCESVIYQLKERRDALPRRLVIAHLGSGCSVTAVRDGQSIDTSMGLTPDGGVVMGTRPGDLDPGLVVYLLRQQTGDASHCVDAVEALLNHSSGVVALSGLENDMRATRQAALDGNEEARLALQVFTRSITKAIGGYAWLLRGLDAVVFTGGIGEHDAATRAEVLEGLSGAGVALDASRNAAQADGVQRVSGADSPVEVFVVPAQEDLMIAMHVVQLANPTT